MEKVWGKGKKFSNLQLVAMGYFTVIAVGTLLLLLPFAANGMSTSFTEALFTAVSASCVTGLVLVDTATHWSLFGQMVILLLLQIGGVGFMTVTLQFIHLIRKKVSLREREVMVESINSPQLGGILSLSKKILAGTVLVEGTGAILLSFRFIPEFGFGKGLYYSVFHAVSAFCNAGFDLMGGKGEFSSLIWYADDILVNGVIMALITVGGIGFLVWDDLYKNHFHWKKYRLHTKLVLSVSAILTFGGGLLFLLLEWNHLGADMGTKEKILTALFQSVTCRTAGFNTVDTAALTEGSKILSMLLMFVGGSPGSTAGGIKTTTLSVLLLYTFAGARRDAQATAFGRSLETDALHKAIAVIMINFSFVLVGTLVICALQPLPATDVFFETFSAMGTVGISTGITRNLGPLSCYILIFIMYCGRVGSMSFAAALLEKRTKPSVSLPSEKIIIG